ncbi:MAG: ATP synthase F1 subunit delta [Cyclobacteriaceae bacterium]
MSDIRVASRYAKSLIELAEEQNSLAEVADDMALLKQVNEQNRDFFLVLKNPIVPLEKKLTILKKIFENKVQPLTILIFEIMIRKNRVSLLPELSEAFYAMYQEKMGIAEATLTITFNPDEQLRSKFKDIVKNATGAKTVILNERISEDIIGGFILTVGDRQIDDSIKTKLKELQINLTTS